MERPSTATPHDNDEFVDRKAKGALESELQGIEPDVLFIHSAGIRRSAATGAWRSVEWGHPGDLGLHTGARTRVLAGAEFARIFPNVPIVANSYNRNSADEPTMASVVAQELVDRGVDEDNIILEEESFSTITQYIELLKLAKEYDWKNVAIMGNEYYKERLEAIFTHLPEIVDDQSIQELWLDFHESGRTLVVMDCEPVLRAMDPHYVNYLDNVYSQPYYREMQQKEAQGLEDINNGRYIYKPAPNVERSIPKS
jgi:hypothetical protein